MTDDAAEDERVQERTVEEGGGGLGLGRHGPGSKRWTKAEPLRGRDKIAQGHVRAMMSGDKLVITANTVQEELEDQLSAMPVTRSTGLVPYE